VVPSREALNYLRACYELKRLSQRARELKMVKKLGQHILVDCNLAVEVLTKLINICQHTTCYVYELGSGLGSLTLFLEKSSGYVIASEIDLKFLDYLRSTFSSSLVDIVASDGVPLIGSLRDSCVVVSNTPYVISSRIIASLVKSPVKAAILVLQDDVAKKIASSPGSRSYGRITAFTRTFMDVDLGGKYPPSSFRPRPKVWSTVVVLRRKRLWSEELIGYEEFLKCLFNQRRRSLRKRLRECVGNVPEDIPHDMRVFSADPDYLFHVYNEVAGLKIKQAS